MYELATVRPHERRAKGYTPVEWPIYCEGYYMALAVTLKVLELAARRYAARTQTRRQQNKAQRSKVGVA